jgi:hypothetical protein
MEEVDRLEQNTARAIAERLVPQATVPMHTAGDQADFNRARKEHERRIEQRKQQVSDAVTALLDTNNATRPASLVDAIARARQRLAVSK